MNTKLNLLSAFAGLALIFTGCTKEPLNNLTREESRIYITNHDSATNFSSFKTFSISDSVTYVNNGRSSRDRTVADQGFINATIAQMKAAGYVQVGKQTNPDVGINISRITNTSTGVIVYDNYYNGYGGYYDPYYWGSGFGGYNYFMPYGYATYSIREGALSIDLLDLKDASANNRIKIVWTGLIRGSGIFSSDANSQVKTLFDQSPYLKTN
ncbi:MAG: DUF4136 domain-containing protein [Chitinophagaceae bacterium]|nr:DUF4136 domain-containing protein [Chitinophagaceae bacterium]